MKASSSGRVLSFGRWAGLGCVTLLLLIGGVWSSWGTAQHVMLANGREHGEFTVTGCVGATCSGLYDPKGPAGPRRGMTMEQSVAVEKGDRFPVVVKPDTDELVRTGTAGLLFAWIPLGGGLLLAAVVVGGGLRLTRTAWSMAAAGCALLLAAFLAL